MTSHARNYRNNPDQTVAPILRSYILELLDENDNQFETKIRNAITVTHPRLHDAQVNAAEQVSRMEAWKLGRARIQKAMDGTDLLEPVFIGSRTGKLTYHDWFKYALFQFGGVGCVALSINGLATYIADTSVIKALENHQPQALLISFIPMLGALAVKSYAANAGSAEAERNCYRKLFRIGIGILGINLTAATLVFGPHPIDLAAVTDVLIGEASPSSAMMAAIKSVGPLVLLGTQLLADTLLAPMLSYQADRLHRAGRHVERPISVEQKILQREIDVIETQIDKCLKKIAAANAVVSRFENDVATQLAAAKRFRHAKQAELNFHTLQARNNFLDAQNGSLS